MESRDSMTASLLSQHIAWKQIIFILIVIIVPNFLVMQVQPFGPIDDRIGIATAIDLVIILPLLLYFFGLKKRGSWLILSTFIVGGVLLANWIIPSEASDYLFYFNNSVIVIEGGIIMLELILLITVMKMLPLLLKNYREEKQRHYHFLLSFSYSIERTFSLENGRLKRFQFLLSALATDIAAIYYSLFWRKNRLIELDKGQSFTFHKDGNYFGVFLMLVHAMALEIIAVHAMLAMYSHLVAWIFTAIDVYALLFIISDYQAIRSSPVVTDTKGIHFQKGIRQYGFISWEQVDELLENTKSPQEVNQDKESVSLAFHGLEKERIPYVLKLKEPVEIRQFFGYKKTIRSIYLKLDNPREFNETIHSYLNID